MCMDIMYALSELHEAFAQRQQGCILIRPNLRQIGVAFA